MINLTIRSGIRENLLLERFFALSLIALVMLGILGVRYTSPDDMGFYLGAHGNVFGYALEHAKSSGRIWLLVTEPVEYLFLNTEYSTYLITLSDIFVTYVLYELFSRVYGSKTAGLWLIIYLAIVPIGWWFNVLVAYPAFYFGLGISCLSSITLIEAILKNNNRYLYFSFILYAIALINYELVTIFTVIFICIIFITYRHKNRIYKIIPYLIITATYVMLYFLWAKYNKTDYTGVQYAQTSISNIWRLNVKYFYSAFAISNPVDFFQGYSLIFTSKIDGAKDGFKFDLSPSILSNFYLFNPYELGKLILFLFFSSALIFFNNLSHNYKSISLKLLPILLYFGFVIPFIFSVKYQDWFLNVNVPAYTNSVFIAVSISLLIPVFLQKILADKLYVKVLFLIFFIIMFIVSNYCRVISVDNILKDNVRWYVVDKIFDTEILKNKITSLDEVYAPALWSHGWMNSFQFKPDQYWQLYTKMMYEQKINLVNSQNKNEYYVFDYLESNVLLLYRLNKVGGYIDDFMIAYPKGYSVLLNTKTVIDKNCHNSICEFKLEEPLNSKISLNINNINHQIRIK